MKSRILLTMLVLALGGTMAFNFNGGEPQLDIAGVWVDSNSAAFQNCYVIFSQKGNKVSMTHYIEFNGTAQVEEGKGKITGQTVSYKVTVTKAVPGWATSGKHTLTLSPDGKTLRGYYEDAKGNKGPLVFKRLR